MNKDLIRFLIMITNPESASKSSNNKTKKITEGDDILVLAYNNGESSITGTIRNQVIDIKHNVHQAPELFHITLDGKAHPEPVHRSNLAYFITTGKFF